MAGIVLERVSRFFAGGAAAVDAIDLEVNDKEFLVLVGPSGCGKTTTLRMIAGLEDVSAGEIRIGGRRVNELPPKDRDIAMVFQNYALYPHMTVRRNMGFALELRRGVSRWRQVFWRIASPRRGARLAAAWRELGDEVERTARMLGIEHLLERLPRQLSGGERQRVALGRAIVRRPAAFLFDEPLSNLDARLRIEMRRELKDLHRRLATTMVYVTHDQVEALTLGDRIVVMDRGVIQQIGSPMELYDRPSNRFVAGFLGSPPMNFFEGSLELAAAGSGELSLRDGSTVIALGAELSARVKSLELRGCVLGVRPEAVRLLPAGERLPPAGGRAEESDSGTRGIATKGFGDRIGENALAGVRFAGRVHLVESLGDATLVSVRYADSSDADAAEQTDASRDNAGRAASDRTDSDGREPKCVVSKQGARTEFRDGQAAWVAFAADAAHLFDAETGLRLVGPPGPDRQTIKGSAFA